MKRNDTSTDSLQAWLPLALVSLVIIALSSLDQSTRGPSMTGMLLTHLNLFF